jgi:hypothetical protein
MPSLNACVFFLNNDKNPIPPTPIGSDSRGGTEAKHETSEERSAWLPTRYSD